MALQLDDLQIDIVVNATSAEKSISKLASSLKTLSTIEINSNPIKAFIKELSEVSVANEGIHTLAKSLKDLSAAAKTFQLPKGLSDTIRDFVKLGSAEDSLMRPLGTKGGDNNGFISFAEQIKSLNEAGKDVSGLQGIALWLSSIATSAKELKGTASVISEVAKAVSRRKAPSQGSLTNEVQDMGDEFTAGGDSGHAVDSEIGNRVGLFEMLRNKISDTRSALADFTLKMVESGNVGERVLGRALIFLNNSFLGLVGTVSKKAASAVFLTPLKRIGESVKNVAERVSHLGAQIKRVAVMRAIRSAIKALTTGLKEGVSALIAWDRTYGNNTSYAAQTADTIAAKWGEVKKSFGAAAMPLIQLVQPALMAVMNTAIEVANIINQIFRALQGYSTYMKATTGAIGDSAKAATGAAKELKKVIFGFDELNILPSDNNGGGGAANSNAGLIDFVETDMDRVFDGSLANIINNLIESIDAKDVARKISEKLNTAITAVNGFLKELNFLAIGQKIGDFLTSAFETIDWNSLGQILIRGITAIPTVLIGVIQKLDLATIGTAIYQFAKGALDTAIEWIRGIDWGQTMYNLFSQLGDLIKSLSPIELVGKILVFALEVVKAVISGLAGAFLGLLETGFDLAGSLIQWISNAWGDLKKWVNTNIKAPIEAFFSALGQTIEYIIDYIFHPAKWGTDFAGGIRQIWDDAFAEIRTSVETTQTYLANKPLKMFLDANIGKLPSIVGYAYAKMQARLNKNPLEFATTVGTSGVNTTVVLARQTAIAQDFASGGVPDVGTLFRAGEAGAEIVATARNGRTGVMNVDQMQEAVASGNIDVVNAIYAMANMLSTELRNKDMNAYISQDAIGQAATRYQNNQTRRGVAY